MPIFDYVCSGCGSSKEHLYLGSESIPDSIACSCVSSSTRSGVYSFNPVGPIWSGLEDYSKAIYGTSGMMRGQEVRTYKDIKKFEEENSFVRTDPNSVKYRSSVDDMKQEALELDRVAEQDGREAVADHIYKQEMKDATGWTNTQYNRWKEISDACDPTDAQLAGGTNCGNTPDPV